RVPGATFRLCSLEQFAQDALNQSPPLNFSVIVMSQVLEHALDPLDGLGRAGELLAEDGVLAVAVPNFAGPYQLLGSRDPFLTPPMHLNFFTPRSMRLAMESAGLRVVKLASRSEI